MGPYNASRVTNLNRVLTHTRPAKGYYTEAEAVQSLGLSLTQFRVLVRRHMVLSDEEMANLSLTSFQPSDLVLLRMLAGQAG